MFFLGMQQQKLIGYLMIIVNCYSVNWDYSYIFACSTVNRPLFGKYILCLGVACACIMPDWLWEMHFNFKTMI